jgi:hypothetical protein
MGWEIPLYSAQGSLDTLLVGRHIGLMHLVCYLRDGDRVLETYWTTRRGVEAMDYSYALMDLTVYGRQEPWEDSPPGCRSRGRTTAPTRAPTDARSPSGRASKPATRTTSPSDRDRQGDRSSGHLSSTHPTRTDAGPLARGHGLSGYARRRTT